MLARPLLAARRHHHRRSHSRSLSACAHATGALELLAHGAEARQKFRARRRYGLAAAAAAAAAAAGPREVAFAHFRMS